MLIPDLILEWPEVAALFDTPDLPWRPEVASWPVPWRRMWAGIADTLRDEGLGLEEAERVAYERVCEGRSNPKRTAGQLAGGGAIRKDPKVMPKMPSKRITKKDRRFAREAGGGLFDGHEDGLERSTTYGMEKV